MLGFLSNKIQQIWSYAYGSFSKDVCMRDSKHAKIMCIY